MTFSQRHCSHLHMRCQRCIAAEISKSGDLLHVIAGANRLRARHDDMTVRIREVDRERDRVAVSAIDTAFETKTILDVVVRARGIELVERALSAPRSKRYPMADA